MRAWYRKWMRRVKIAFVVVVVGFVVIVVATHWPQGQAEPAYHDGESTAVMRVIDGDTVVVTGGRKVRLLAIDACEAGTRGGDAATAYARATLEGRTVLITPDGRRDMDGYGRLLRRITVDGRDYGEQAVTRPDVGLYAGQNDASVPYYERVRMAEAVAGAGPRTC